MAIEDGYTILDTTLVEGKIERRVMECNAKVICATQGGLIGSEFGKEMHYTSAKEIWDKLMNMVYEGDGKVKGAKLQTYKRQFEYLKMKEDEDIAAYFLWVDEIVNTMRGL